MGICHSQNRHQTLFGEHEEIALARKNSEAGVGDELTHDVLVRMNKEELRDIVRFQQGQMLQLAADLEGSKNARLQSATAVMTQAMVLINRDKRKKFLQNGVTDYDEKDPALMSQLDEDLREQLTELLMNFAETEFQALRETPFSKLIHKSGLDEQTKKWLTTEFTREGARSSKSERDQHSFSVSRSGELGRVWSANALPISNMEMKERDVGDGLGPSRSDGELPRLAASFAPSPNGTTGYFPPTPSSSSASAGVHPALHHHQSSLRLEQLWTTLDWSEFDSWNFDCTQHSPETLVLYACKMIDAFHLLFRFQIKSDVLRTFMMAVRDGYVVTNDYHNFLHAVDTMHVVYMYLKRSDCVRLAQISSLDVLALLVSAICHDLGHPGTNNTYQIVSQSELALIYNDQSVLEHFHTAQTFRLLRKSECNILSNLNTHQMAKIRKTIVSCILATDMTVHFQMVSKLDQLFDKMERAFQYSNVSPSATVNDNTAGSTPATAPSATVSPAAPVVSPALATASLAPGAPQSASASPAASVAHDAASSHDDRPPAINTQLLAASTTATSASSSSATNSPSSHAGSPAASLVPTVNVQPVSAPGSVSSTPSPPPVAAAATLSSPSPERHHRRASSGVPPASASQPTTRTSLDNGRPAAKGAPSGGKRLSASHPASGPPAAHGLSPSLPASFSREDMQRFLNVLIHSADVSNVTRPWPVSKRWSDRIGNEFFKQGDLEKQNSYPVSPFMDRDNENQAQMSLNFIDFIVAPLLVVLVHAFPSLSDLADNIITNRETWHKLLMQKIDSEAHVAHAAAASVSTTVEHIATAHDDKETERENSKRNLSQRALQFQSTFILPVTDLQNRVEQGLVKAKKAGDGGHKLTPPISPANNPASSSSVSSSSSSSSSSSTPLRLNQPVPQRKVPSVVLTGPVSVPASIPAVSSLTSSSSLASSSSTSVSSSSVSVSATTLSTAPLDLLTSDATTPLLSSSSLSTSTTVTLLSTSSSSSGFMNSPVSAPDYLSSDVVPETASNVSSHPAPLSLVVSSEYLADVLPSSSLLAASSSTSGRVSSSATSQSSTSPTLMSTTLAVATSSVSTAALGPVGSTSSVHSSNSSLTLPSSTTAELRAPPSPMGVPTLPLPPIPSVPPSPRLTATPPPLPPKKTTSNNSAGGGSLSPVGMPINVNSIFDSSSIAGSSHHRDSSNYSGRSSGSVNSLSNNNEANKRDSKELPRSVTVNNRDDKRDSDSLVREQQLTSSPGGNVTPRGAEISKNRLTTNLSPTGNASVVVSGAAVAGSSHASLPPSSPSSPNAFLATSSPGAPKAPGVVMEKRGSRRLSALLTRNMIMSGMTTVAEAPPSTASTGQTPQQKRVGDISGMGSDNLSPRPATGHKEARQRSPKSIFSGVTHTGVKLKEKLKDGSLLTSINQTSAEASDDPSHDSEDGFNEYGDSFSS